MASNITGSKHFSLEEVDWEALRRLRARFLQFDTASGASADYWRSYKELVSYDLTFGERIGWKWDRVLSELESRGWTPPEGELLDWGCGTGIAGRRVAGKWPKAFKKLHLWDRSRDALQFAQKRAKEAGIRGERWEGDAVPQTLVISHVLNELDRDGLEKLLTLAKRAEVVLWVEPGTSAVAKNLVTIRERLNAEGLRPYAPCPHFQTCGLLAAGNERHWCHHFAPAPREVFQDPAWGRFAKLLEVDLGTVPFSYLVLDRRADQESPNSRILGTPRVYKGLHKILSCQREDVAELTLQKRDAPDLYKALKKDPGTLYRWEREGEKIREGVQIF